MRRMHNTQKNCRITYVGVSRKFDYENVRARERNGEIHEERMRKY